MAQQQQRPPRPTHHRANSSNSLQTVSSHCNNNPQSPGGGHLVYNNSPARHSTNNSPSLHSPSPRRNPLAAFEGYKIPAGTPAKDVIQLMRVQTELLDADSENLDAEGRTLVIQANRDAIQAGREAGQRRGKRRLDTEATQQTSNMGTTTTQSNDGTMAMEEGQPGKRARMEIDDTSGKPSPVQGKPSPVNLGTGNFSLGSPPKTTKRRYVQAKRPTPRQATTPGIAQQQGFLPVQPPPQAASGFSFQHQSPATPQAAPPATPQAAQSHFWPAPASAQQGVSSHTTQQQPVSFPPAPFAAQQGVSSHTTQQQPVSFPSAPAAAQQSVSFHTTQQTDTTQQPVSFPPAASAPAAAAAPSPVLAAPIVPSPYEWDNKNAPKLEYFIEYARQSMGRDENSKLLTLRFLSSKYASVPGSKQDKSFVEWLGDDENVVKALLEFFGWHVAQVEPEESRKWKHESAVAKFVKAYIDKFDVKTKVRCLENGDMVDREIAIVDRKKDVSQYGSFGFYVDFYNQKQEKETIVKSISIHRIVPAGDVTQFVNFTGNPRGM